MAIEHLNGFQADPSNFFSNKYIHYKLQNNLEKRLKVQLKKGNGDDDVAMNLGKFNPF